MKTLGDWLWLVLVLALFSVPLFVGLGRSDVGDDEAIYSFAVDRILETGDWLAPKKSPFEDAVFLEKPPLKFWIVAAPIRLGVLPHNEFGVRFWDALFGAVAFLYVFAIGRRLGGPLCGAVAVLILFVHGPLLFEHGLRSNNMEASLVLCYCGGIFHYLGWATASNERWRRCHAAGAGLYFVLGFMTKFVAAAFLPLVMAITSLLFLALRARLARDWRVWSGVGALALALIAPWFLYAYARFGPEVVQTMFGVHVYVRFTAFLDPAHVHPWNFYFTELYLWFARADSHVLVISGIVLMTVETLRRRWLEGTVVVLWFALPMLLMSFLTSKLYHYTYAFLPPLALAGGYLCWFATTHAPGPLARGFQIAGHFIATGIPAVMKIGRRPAVRAAMRTIAVAAAIVAAITILYGPIRIAFRGSAVFRSSGLLRPMMLVALFGTLGFGKNDRQAARIAVALLVASTLPLLAYRETLPGLTIERHPMRTASECLARLGSPTGGTRAGLYVDAADRYLAHALYYYFRRVRPLVRAPSPDPAAIDRYLYNQAEWRPLLVWDSTYQAFMNGRSAAQSRPPSPPMVAFRDVLLLLPGPYEKCSAVTAHEVGMR